MRSFSAFLLDPFRSAWQRRGLVRELSVREIRATFTGSMLGVGWVVLQPLLTLAVYALVFGGIVGIGRDRGMAFVSQLFAGMIVFQAFAESVGRAPRLVVSKPNFVTKVAFPLDLLPWPNVALAALHAAVSTLLLITLHTAFVGPPAWTALLLPLVLLPVLLLGLAASWVLSSLGVYVRDTADVVRVLLQLLFFLSPIVWTLQDCSETGRVLAMCNPLAAPIEACRAMLAGTPLPGAPWLVGFVAVTPLLTGAGHAFFRRTKDGFADVL